MKNRFITNLAQDVVKQNIHWKEEYQKLQLRFKDYETLIIKSLKSMPFIQIHQIEEADTYSCLQLLAKKVLFNNNSLEQLNIKLKKIEQEIREKDKIITQISVNKEANQSTILQKERQFQKYKQQNQLKMQSLKDQITLQTNQKKNYQRQYQKTLQKLSKIQTELNEQCLKKIQQFIRSQKNQMVQYRKNVEEEAWKIQQILRGQCDSKGVQIKNLIQIIGSFSKDQKQANTNQNLTTLEELMKPYLEYNQLNMKLSEVRRQSIQAKSELRNEVNNRLGLQNKNQELKSSLDILKIQHKKIKQQHNIFSEENAKLKSQIDKVKKQNETLVKYYDEKWIQQFNKVRENLQKKILLKQSNLQRQYQEKKKFLKNQINTYLANEQILNQQKLLLVQRNDYLQEQYNTMFKQHFQLLDKVNQLKNCLRQSDQMHGEQMSTQVQFQRIQTQQMNIMLQQLRYQIKQQQEVKNLEVKKVQSQMKCAKIHIQRQKKILTEAYEAIIEQINMGSREKDKFIQQLKQQVKNMQNDFKEKVKEIMQKHQNTKEQIEVKQSYQSQYKQLKLIKQRLDKKNKEDQQKIKQLTLETNNLQQEVKKCQRLIKAKQLAADQEAITNRQKITSLSTKITVYQKQILYWKQQIKYLQLQVKSLKNIIETKQCQLISLNIEIKEIVRQKNQSQNAKKIIQRQAKEGFKQLKIKCDNLIEFYKNRTKELETLLGRHQISEQDYQKIKSLSIKNQKLEDKMSMKEAQNLILTQVKAYYEAKVQEINDKKEYRDNLRNTNKSIFIKKPRKTRQMISIRKEALQTEQSILETKEVINLKRYIKKRNHENSSLTTFRQKNNSSLT